MGAKKGNRTIAIGLMLFALWFGAGNLIFPASMGQAAGTNVWYAVGGFVITGVGLPLLGVLAMGYSGCSNLQELTNRIDKRYAIFFTVISYLAIGPAFAIPRTGTVSYEIAVRPLLNNGGSDPIMWAFLVVFFIITWWLSISPAKLQDPHAGTAPDHPGPDRKIPRNTYGRAPGAAREIRNRRYGSVPGRY